METQPHPLLSRKGIAAKLAPKFEGSYWITAVLGSNTYRLVSDGGQVEEIVAADQLKPYHGELPESNEVDTESGSGEEPAGDLPVSQERKRERPPRACSDAPVPAESPWAKREATNAPRRGRGRPRKNP